MPQRTPLQEQLALTSGINSGDLSAIENRIRPAVSLRSIHRIAQALEVETYTLLKFETIAGDISSGAEGEEQPSDASFLASVFITC